MTTQPRALLIGASGQVGAQIARILPKSSTVLVSKDPARSDRVHIDLQTVAGDDKTANQILKYWNIDVVYCVGAMTYVDGCEAAEPTAMKINCEGPATLATAAARRGARFVYFSSDYVFDGRSGPYRESDPGSPINAYGRSKWLGELEVLKACPDALIIRTTGVYGPDENAKNFLYSLKRDLTVEGRAVVVPDDQISTPTYNRDLAQATTALVNAGASGIYHVAGPELVSRLEFARRAAVTMGLDPEGITGVPTSELHQVAPRPLNAGLKTDKLKSFFPGLPMRGIEEAVADWISNSSAS